MVVKSNNLTSKNYPFDKYGCNAILYMSPPQCKKIWKIYDLKYPQVGFFLPRNIVRQLKNVRYINDSMTSYELSDMFGLSAIFPKYVVVVQREEQELPLSLFFALDFNNISNDHAIEYQTNIFVSQFTHYEIADNFLRVKLVPAFYDWKPETFKRQLETIKESCETFQLNSCGCLISYSSHGNMNEPLIKLSVKHSHFEKFPLSVVGTTK